MKSRVSRVGAVLLGCCGTLLTAGLPTSVLAGDAADRQVAADLVAARGRQSLNLARAGFGAHLEVVGAAADGAAVNALLTEDDPLGYRLAAGATSMVLTLPKIETLHRFNFINLTAGGKVSIAVSNTKLTADSSEWRTVETGKEFSPSGSEVVTCDLGNTEARYIKLDFEVQAPGSIDTFGLFGMRSLASQPAMNSRRVAASKETGAPGGDRALLYNYAVASDRAGVIMVSPGENLQDSQKMADGDMGTSFRFRADDPRPMAVIDLGESRPVNRIGMSFRSGPGHLDIYLLPDPEKRDGVFHRANNTGGAGSGTRTIQEVIASDFPAGLEPVISKDVAVQPGLTRVSGSANEQIGRYLVMTFKPSGSVAGGQTEAAVDFKDFKDFKDTGATAAAPAGATGQPLDVPEISVFGNTPPGTYTSIPPIIPNVPNTPGNGITVVPPILPPGSGGTVITP